MSELPNGWVETTLGKVYNFSSGLSKKRDQFGFGYDFLTFKDVFSNWFLPKKLNSLANTTKQERYKCSIKRGDVFLTRTSETQEELGMSSVALKDYKDAAFNGFTKRLRPKEGLNISPEFIGYYFRSRYFRATIQTMASMTTRASLNNDTLSILPILLPSLPEQKAISAVLSAFDEKIKLLQEQNETLETLAQTIFKEWFVHFNYPGATGEMVDSELGEIPKGWLVGKLGEIAEIASGKRPKNRTNNKTTTHQIPLIGATKTMGFVEDYLYCENILVIGRVGTHGEIQRFHEKIWPSDNTLIIKASNFDFVYFILKSIDYGIMNRGAVQALITQTDLKKYPVIIPDNEIMNKFKGITTAIFEKIKNNTSQIQTLTKTRDTLLPKLMSGKIRVEGFGQ